ncbi:MAG: hypothetical protein IPG86_20065 [Chitinophagaceae bacterium]|nr:hypothetical protein [Chitinophagaceae bacterium]
MEIKPDTPNTLKENIRAMRILCIALITGVIIFTVIMTVLVAINGPAFDPGSIHSYEQLIIGGMALVAIISFGFAITGYNKKINVLKQSGDTLNDRLNVYRGILIKYMAATEMPALMSVIAYFLSGLTLLIGITVLSLLAMVWKAPFGRRWVTEMGADWQDEEKMKS